MAKELKKANIVLSQFSTEEILQINSISIKNQQIWKLVEFINFRYCLSFKMC